MHISALRFVFLIVALLVTGCGDKTSEPQPVDLPYDSGGPGTTDGPDNRPPELHKIGNRIVQVGKKLVINPKATDADGDSLKFSFYGDKPKGYQWNPDVPLFRWTPTKAGQTIALTFLVSDALSTDKESIEVQVVTEAQNHPPSFQKVGDQVIEAGTYYVLTLQASDPNGNQLIYSHKEPLPEKSMMNGNVFEWTPSINSEGFKSRITFTVSDGQAIAELPVNFHVVAPGQNKPPVFIDVGPQIAQINTPYSLDVNVFDPDSDLITVSMENGAPQGSQFNTATRQFTWTPSEADANKAYTLEFKATDGQYTTYWDVNVQVKGIDVQGKCVDDVFEKNNSGATAAAITTGTYEDLSICDTTVSPVDADWFSVPLTVGQTLSVKALFTHEWGDIDLRIYGPDLYNGSPIAEASSADDNEFLSHPIKEKGLYFIEIYGVSAITFKNSYTLEVSTTGLGCQDDEYEPNDNFQSAQTIDGNAYYENGQYCPGDPDVYKVAVGCGQNLNAAITFNAVAGNLDFEAYREENTKEPVVSSKSNTGTEPIVYGPAPYDEMLYLKVVGKPIESTINEYTLSTKVSGQPSCNDADEPGDNYEPNDTLEKATFLTPPKAEIKDAQLCCTKDWYYVPLQMADILTATVKFKGEANVKLTLFAPGGSTILGHGTPTDSGLEVTLESAKIIGNHYLVVEGDPGVTYDVAITISSSEGCSTSKGCDPGKVCEKSTGDCVDAFCTSNEQCPTGQEMPCIETVCMDACSYDADCRLSYACKGFDQGKFCGTTGEKITGDACTNHKQCKGQASCHFKTMNGYCSNVGCTSNAQCPTGSSCIKHTSYWLCSKKCQSNDDCRKEDGFTCQPKPLPNGVTSNVCLPPQ